MEKRARILLDRTGKPESYPESVLTVLKTKQESAEVLKYWMGLDKMNNVSHLDKVVIILSFLHKNDLELLRDFLAEFKLSDIDRQSIIERINQNPSFPVDQIQMVLKEFFELTQNEALFNMTNDVSNEIQQLVSSDEISVSKETIKESLFHGIANDVLFEFLDNQGEDVKGLLCHMLETDDLKKLLPYYQPIK